MESWYTESYRARLSLGLMPLGWESLVTTFQFEYMESLGLCCTYMGCWLKMEQ